MHDSQQATLSHDLAQRLSARSGSVFQALAEERTHSIASRLLEALAADLRAGSHGAKQQLGAIVDELMLEGLTFADLRHLLQSLRQVSLSGLAGVEGTKDDLARVEDLLFQCLMMGTTRFVAAREWAWQETTAKADVRQLESQLVELKAAYEEKARLLAQIREAQTPIAPVYEGVLVVPLVGVLDTQRAQEMTTKLLESIIAMQARVVLLDVSGVPVFDASTAEHVVGAAKAVRLLGAELVLVGVSPQVAKTVVELGLGLGELETRATLRAGLAQALASLGLQITRIAEKRRPKSG